MNKILCIGECELNILFSQGQPTGAVPGGAICRAAAMMAQAGVAVGLASEASADAVGNIALAPLKGAGVDLASVDRFSEGRTPLNIITAAADGTTTCTRYENYPDDAFDIVWPRIADDSIVVYGGYYTLDSRMRRRMLPFLQHCAERGALMVYVPGFDRSRQSRMTRVMPEILENLELAHLVVASAADLHMIFGTDTPAKGFANHIAFYCNALICPDAATSTLAFYSGKEVSQCPLEGFAEGSLAPRASLIAGVGRALLACGVTAADLEHADATLRQQVLAKAAQAPL